MRKNQAHRNAQTRAWRERMKTEGKLDEIWYKHHLKTKYGLTLDRYKEMLATQDGVCAICKRPATEGKRLSVDHCHTTLKNRGLLCSECNFGLGKFQDNPAVLYRAIEYLNAWVN